MLGLAIPYSFSIFECNWVEMLTDKLLLLWVGGLALCYGLGTYCRPILCYRHSALTCLQKVNDGSFDFGVCVCLRYGGRNGKFETISSTRDGLHEVICSANMLFLFILALWVFLYHYFIICSLAGTVFYHCAHFTSDDFNCHWDRSCLERVISLWYAVLVSYVFLILSVCARITIGSLIYLSSSSPS